MQGYFLKSLPASPSFVYSTARAIVYKRKQHTPSPARHRVVISTAKVEAMHLYAPHNREQALSTPTRYVFYELEYRNNSIAKFMAD